jgi:hypothetical protein
LQFSWTVNTDNFLSTIRVINRLFCHSIVFSEFPAIRIRIAMSMAANLLFIELFQELNDQKFKLRENLHEFWFQKIQRSEKI